MSQPNINLAKTLAEGFLRTNRDDLWALKPKGQRGAIVAVLEDEKVYYDWYAFADLLVKLSNATEMTYDTWRQAANMAEQSDEGKLPLVLLFEGSDDNLRGMGTLACLTRPMPAPKRRKPKGFGRSIPRPKGGVKTF
jgi:hypothetical protein